jgi:CubicO group peptidase (beta-lactamase class C family)
MQLEEQGLIELDAPANDYLRAVQLMPAKASWRPATVRHLLTHTAGVPEWLPRSAPPPAPQQSRLRRPPLARRAISRLRSIFPFGDSVSGAAAAAVCSDCSSSALPTETS